MLGAVEVKEQREDNTNRYNAEIVAQRQFEPLLAMSVLDMIGTNLFPSAGWRSS